MLFVTPFGFARIAASGLIGYVFFHDAAPSRDALIGFALICVGVVLNTVAERNIKRQNAVQTASTPGPAVKIPLAAMVGDDSSAELSASAYMRKNRDEKVT